MANDSGTGSAVWMLRNCDRTGGRFTGTRENAKLAINSSGVAAIAKGAGRRVIEQCRPTAGATLKLQQIEVFRLVDLDHMLSHEAQHARTENPDIGLPQPIAGHDVDIAIGMEGRRKRLARQVVVFGTRVIGKKPR